ncbi:MAG: LD-carboxypeptidase [Candidatus Acidiferrum sp.]
MNDFSSSARKPRALSAGSKVALFAPASPAQPKDIAAGIAELGRLGLAVNEYEASANVGYFAASAEERRREFAVAIQDDTSAGVIALRGGYGANYLLESETGVPQTQAKCVVGFSDITSLQIYLWERRGWVTIHGPMVAAGLNHGAGAPHGYDEASFLRAIRETTTGWPIDLHGETLAPGEAEGRLLGGCMTLLEATMGTAWELDTRGAILVLEDRAMKPYQVDRVLMHLKQAGKLEGVAGIVLGEFPDSEPPVKGSPTVREVCARVLGPLGVPILFGAPVGHTPRPMLTLPLGVKARLSARGEGRLEILEPAVMA